MATQPHRYSTSILVGSATYTRNDTVSATALAEINESVVTATTNLEMSIALDVSEVDSFVINSTAAVTVKINDSTTPDYTFTLVANEPQFWSNKMLGAFPLTTDVTSVFVTNASGSTAQLMISAYQDATP